MRIYKELNSSYTYNINKIQNMQRATRFLWPNYSQTTYILGIWPVDKRMQAVTGTLLKLGRKNITIQTAQGLQLTTTADSYKAAIGRTGLVACQIYIATSFATISGVSSTPSTTEETASNLPDFEVIKNSTLIQVTKAMHGHLVSIEYQIASWLAPSEYHHQQLLALRDQTTIPTQFERLAQETL